MRAGIHDCQAVTGPTVDNCNKGDFGNYSFKSPSSFRRSSEGALTDLCLIRHSTGAADRGGPRMGTPGSISFVGLKRVSSLTPQLSGGISVAVFAKGRREERKSGIDQNVFILLLARRGTNIPEP